MLYSSHVQHAIALQRCKISQENRCLMHRIVEFLVHLSNGCSCYGVAATHCCGKRAISNLATGPVLLEHTASCHSHRVMTGKSSFRSVQTAWLQERQIHVLAPCYTYCAVARKCKGKPTPFGVACKGKPSARQGCPTTCFSCFSSLECRVPFSVALPIETT